MTRSRSAFVLVTVLQVIFGQPGEDNLPLGPHSANDPRPGPLMHPFQERIPRHCWAPPAGISSYQCCPIPNLYADEIMDSCGIQKPPPDGKPPQNRPPPDFECKRGKCLMKHSQLLNEDESINYEKVNKFLDDWAHNHTDFTEAILIGKQNCAREGGPPGPPNLCYADKMYFCLTANILWNCKLKEEIEGCQVLKEHREECKPYYLKPKDQEEI